MQENNRADFIVITQHLPRNDKTLSLRKVVKAFIVTKLRFIITINDNDKISNFLAPLRIIRLYHGLFIARDKITHYLRYLWAIRHYSEAKARVSFK